MSHLHDERVAACLRDCEQAWVNVFTKTGELNLALVAARSARRYSPITGHQILSAAGKAQALAGEGQGELASIHRMLARFAEANHIVIKMDEGDYGDGRKPPSGMLDDR